MFLQRLSFYLCLLLMAGCADVVGDPPSVDDGQAAAPKARLQAIDAGPGNDCALGCVWSSFAVSLGAQSASYSCGGVPCACVKWGDVYNRCEADIGESSLGDLTGGASSEGGGLQIAGFSCGDGCLWSTYAVTLGAQSREADCQGQPCACVQDGNVWARCEAGPPPSTSVGAPAQPPARSGRDVPYFYQYNNRLSPSATCQNTSIAMVLAHYGWSGKPDDITAEFGRHRAQSPAGLADVFNTLSRRAGISRRATPYTNGTLAGLRAELDAGRPVIVHGYFTRYGHVVVVTGYDSRGYYVHDPAGMWSETFKGGYPYAGSAWAGADAYYGRAAFEAAVATSNGYAYLAPWYHAIR